jgi:hypothetical protein
VDIFTPEDSVTGDASLFSSLDQGVLKKAFTSNAPIKITKVPSVTIRTLFEKHSVGRVDLLQIDTEGYDYEILKSIDLDEIRPTVIHFEHAHMGHVNLERCLTHLIDNNYYIHIYKIDTVAVKRCLQE